MTSLRRVAIPFGLLLVVGCGLAEPPSAASTEPALPYGPVEILGRTGRVTRASTVRLPRDEGHWRPTRTDLEGFERAIGPYARALPREAYYAGEPDFDLATALEGYHRQYVGITEGGRRVVRVSLYCPRFDLPMGVDSTFFFEMNDGGACNCEALYDPALGQVLRLHTAGDA